MKLLLSIFTTFIFLTFSVEAQDAKRYGVADNKGNLTVPVEFESITPLKGGLLAVRKYDLWGVSDMKGRVIVPRKYQSIDAISEKLLIVKDQDKTAVIDTLGNVIVPFDYNTVIPLEDDYFIVNKMIPSSCLYNGLGNKVIPINSGIIMPLSTDRRSLIITDLQTGSNKLVDYHDNILWEEEGKKLSDLRNGYLAVSSINNSDSFFEIVDIEGVVVNPKIKIEDNQFFEDTFLRYKEDGNIGLKDINGKIIVSPIYSNVHKPKNGFMKVEKDSTRFGNNQYGIVNLAGETIIDCMYDQLGDVVDGRIKGLAEQKYGFLNTDGLVVIPFEYDYASDFRNKVSILAKGRKFGLINTQGKTILPLDYDNIVFLNDSCLALYKDLKCCVMGTNGKVLIPFEYDGVGDMFDNEYITIRKNRKWGVIDIKGNEIITPSYLSIEIFSDNYFIVSK